MANFTWSAGTLYLAKAPRARISGNEPGAEIAMVLPLSSCIDLMLSWTKMPCGTVSHRQPMTLTSTPRKSATIAPPRSALVTVEFPRQRRLEPDLIVLDFHGLDLQAELVEKAALLGHHEEAGVGLGSITPWRHGLPDWADAAPPDSASVSAVTASQTPMRRDSSVLLMTSSLAAPRQSQRWCSASAGHPFSPLCPGMPVPSGQADYRRKPRWKPRDDLSPDRVKQSLS